MSDEDERQPSSNTSSFHDTNSRRLHAIKLKLQELTREKTKYNVEKLTHDYDFVLSEIGHLTHAIADINKDINAQTTIKKTLNAKTAILRSNSGLRYANLEIAHRDKERYEKELEKTNKSEVYRDLARGKIKAIEEALPQLQKQDEYNRQLQEAEDAQNVSRNKREKLVENLNSKSRKQAEIRQLLNDSTTKLPEIETAIENLRLEREHISPSTAKKKPRHRPSIIQQKSLDSPVHPFSSLEQDTLEYEKRNCIEKLEKLRLLLKYFREKLAEHNLSTNTTPCSTPSSELVSPLYHPITPIEEKSILSSYIDEQDSEKNLFLKLTTTNDPTVAIAMKLPRNFVPLDLNSTTTNEIIHSPYHQENPIEYKKEIPSDIIDKYAGIANKNHPQQQTIHGKRNKKNKKNFGIKYTSQMMVLYNDVRTSSGGSDALPFLPMFEYELLPAIKALQLLEQSVESYLNDLSQRYQYPVIGSGDEEHSEIPEDDEIRDSALDTYSETSSLIEPTNLIKDSISVIPQLMDIPQARSSSSSDDKKTIVSSASPPSSHHSHSKIEHQSISIGPLTTVEESPSYLPPLTIQIAQIERQISDEGYRSVRNEQQRHASRTNNNNSPLLTRSKSYDSTDKVDKWLSSTTPPLPTSTADENIHPDFQATDMDNDEENLIQSTIPVPDDN